MSITIQSIEERIKQYEEEIVKIVNTHGNLMGGLNELKQLLSIASDVVSVVAPEASPIVDVVSEAVDGIDAALTPDVTPVSDVVETPAISDIIA